MSYHIVNAKIVNEGTVIMGDLSVARGRILGVNVPPPRGAEVVDAAGAYLLPGMIDDQVHFREPGLAHKATIATESRAAVAGGVTSYLEMPNCDPQTVTASALEDKHARAAARSMANYGFYLGATNDTLDAIKAVDRRLACGIKIFMGSSTGNMLVDDERTLEGIFAASPLVIATHCEHTPTIVANEAAARARYGDNIPFTEHPHIRSADACYRSSSLAVEPATRYDARLHVLHITTARELSLFEPGDLADKRITSEACVHHLFFNDTSYPAKGADIKCNTRCSRCSSMCAPARSASRRWSKRPRTHRRDCSASQNAGSSGRAIGPIWCWSIPPRRRATAPSFPSVGGARSATSCSRREYA